MKTEILLITPEIAKEMLTHNINNRPLSAATVAQYKSEMERGLWLETGAPIQFAEDGRLIDGQNRLTALIEANRSIRFVVVRGLESDAFRVIDKGKRRRISEDMATDSRLKGYESKNFNALASSIKLAHRLAKGGMTAKTGSNVIRLTSTETIAEYLAHKDIYDRAASMAMKCYQKLNFLNKQEIGGIYAFLVIYMLHEEQKVSQFFTELFYGYQNPTICLLRDRLVKDKMGNSSLTPSYRMALIAKTWNAYLADKELKVIKYNEEVEGRIKFN